MRLENILYKRIITPGRNDFFKSECNKYFLKKFRTERMAKSEKIMNERCKDIDGILKHNDHNFGKNGYYFDGLY